MSLSHKESHHYRHPFLDQGNFEGKNMPLLWNSSGYNTACRHRQIDFLFVLDLLFLFFPLFDYHHHDDIDGAMLPEQ